MTPYITRALAQQIVDTVRDLCGQWSGTWLRRESGYDGHIRV